MGTGARMGRPRKFTEAQVVRDATGVFWDRGFHETSVADLSRATGVLPGSLYGAFGDKHGLLEAALASYMHDSRDRVCVLLKGPSSPLEGLRSYLEQQLELACGTGPRHGCLMAKTALELAPEDTAVTATVGRNFAGLRELLADAVRAAQVAGEISERWEPEAVAGSLLAIVEGFQVLGRTDPPEMLRGGYELVLEALR